MPKKPLNIFSLLLLLSLHTTLGLFGQKSSFIKGVASSTIIIPELNFHFPSQNEDLLYSGSMELEELSKLVIKNAKGEIQITGVSNDRLLEIRIYQEIKVSLINRTDVDKAEVKVWNQDDGVYIETLASDYTRSSKYAPAYRIELKVPQNINLFIDNQLGDVNVADLNSTYAIACSNGSITLKNAFGNNRSRMKTVNGQINLFDFTGSMMCLVKEGNLYMEDVDAEIRARTYRGNIIGEGLKGNYICETKVGNIQLELLEITKLVNLSSSVGNTLLFANKRFDYTIEMSGNDIELVDQGRFTGNKEKNSVKGNIGSGGANVVLSSKTGQTIMILKSFD